MNRSRVVVVAFFTSLILAACSGSTAAPALPVKPAASAGNPSPTPNALFISDPRQGLDALQSYHMHLSKQFSGKADGADVRSSLEIDADQAPETRFVTILQKDEDGTITQLMKGVAGDASYSRAGDFKAACRVTWDPAEKSPPPLWPADLLPGFSAAKKVGPETINSISAVHYTLDAASAGRVPAENLTGDLWLAEQGGYVLKLNMTITGAEKTFGTGRSGTQTLAYELTRVNSGAAFVLPEGCLPVLEDVPVMTDAADLHRYPDTVRYLTMSSADTVMVFYKEKFEAGGWKAANAHPYSGGGQVMMFVHPEKPESLLLDVTPAGKGERVTIARLKPVVKNAPQDGTTGGATPAPVNTLDPSKSGLPADIPIYAGAENFGGYEGIRLEFSVKDPVDKVKEFYKTALKKAGWAMIPGTGNTPSAPLMFRKGGSMVILQLTDEAGGTRVAITKAK